MLLTSVSPVVINKQEEESNCKQDDSCYADTNHKTSDKCMHDGRGHVLFPQETFESVQ